MLGDLGPDLGQLYDLMTVDLVFQRRLLLLFRELATAAFAGVRKMRDYPCDLLDRNQGPAAPGMPRLTAGFALAFRALRVSSFSISGAIR